MRKFIKVNDLSSDEIIAVLKRADVLQKAWQTNSMPRSLSNRQIGMSFYGNGFRNRVAFEMGARAMGAEVTYIPGELGIQEPIEDITHYLNNWFSMLVIRCKRHEDIERIALDASMPVINARTNINHPCEIIGDLQYIYGKRGSIGPLRVVFVGEVTNLCMSWFEAAKVLPIEVTQIAPVEYSASPEFVDKWNVGSVGRIMTSSTMSDVHSDIDVLYTDCWPKDREKSRIRELFIPYQITGDVVRKICPNGFFMPCPPVTRGEEITEDSLASHLFCDYQAKNCLLHAQNAIMEYYLH
jgi:ornithine carbamoyltransferase